MNAGIEILNVTDGDTKINFDAKRVISFSLYGDDRRYLIGAIRNAILAKKFYPDWICRFYVHERTLSRHAWACTQLEMIDAEVITMGPDTGIPPMFWRFLVADDADVERFVVRDCDSRVGQEEAAAVAEWIKDDTILHTCRAHPAHGRPINGGMWGLQTQRDNWRAPNFTHAIEGFLKDHPDPMGYSVDQDFLCKWLWHWAKSSATQHDAVTRLAYPGSKPFPVKWAWPRFMGEVILVDANGNDYPREGDYQQIPEDETKPS